MVVIVFGTREWDDYELIFWRLALLPKDTVIRHGAARGADRLASRAAKELGLKEDPYPVHPSEWDRIGASAGHRRNERMAKAGADLAIGFRCPGKSNGTDGMRDYAEAYGIPVERHGTGWKENKVSSTNRGEGSTELWETPLWTVRRLLEEVWLPPGEWCEPCAGNGRIIRAVNEDRPGAFRWTTCELRKECAPVLKQLDGVVNVACPTDFVKDFEAYKQRGKHPQIADPRISFFDVLIMNPPFSLSMEMLSKALAISEYVVMLQRANWVGSGANNGKNDFLRGCMPDVYNLPDRVKFLIDGKFPRYPVGTMSRDGKKDLSGQLMPGDSIEYCWYVWGPKATRMREAGLVRQLRVTSVDERTDQEEAT